MGDEKVPSAVLKVTGFISLILGICLVLLWWPDVVAWVKGCLGMFLAVTGLFILYIARK